MSGFDRWMEDTARSLARKVGRRSFLSKAGAVLIGAAGATALPVLPVARAAKGEVRVPAPNEDIEGPEGDPKRCEYWRHCAIDGFACACCGGSARPGTRARR